MSQIGEDFLTQTPSDLYDTLYFEIMGYLSL